MTTKRQRLLHGQRKELEDHGWLVDKQDALKFNSGSETLAHLQAKMVAAKVLQDNGYRIDTEVQMPAGEVDVLGYSEQDCIVVECETDPDSGTVSSKLNRYVHGQPPREMFLIVVDNVPGTVGDAYNYITEQIFG